MHPKRTRFYKHIPLADRFWAKVARSENGCWEWTGTRLPKLPYGHIRDIPANGSRSRMAHRVSWQLHYGAIPPGMNVLHRCDNPPCVRPDHLFLGTAQDNVLDMMAKGRAVRHGGAKNPPRGDNCVSSKLRSEQVLDIRRRNANGESQHSLARVFGVSVSAINLIVLRRNWAHI